MRIPSMTAVVVGLLVALAAVAVQAVPVVFTTADGNGADCAILGHGTGPGSQEMTNFNTGGGYAGDLRVYDFTYNMTDGNARTYLRFNVPTSTWTGGNLDGTTLTLTVKSASAGFGQTNTSRITFLGLNDAYTGGADDNLDNPANGPVADLGNNWGETAITWANAPGHQAQQDGNSSGVAQWQAANCTVLGFLDVGWQSVSNGSKLVLSGAALGNWIKTDTDGLLTIFLVDQKVPIASDWYQGGNSFFFYSHDGAMAGSPSFYPTLTLAPLPEPTAAMLLLAGAGVLGLRRRRN